MVWCTCPARCKGGRQVSRKTHSRHKKELEGNEREQIIRQFFPERFLPPTDGLKKRSRVDEDDDDRAQGKVTHAKKARANGRGQDSLGETPFVSTSADLLILLWARLTS